MCIPFLICSSEITGVLELVINEIISQPLVASSDELQGLIFIPSLLDILFAKLSLLSLVLE